MKPFLYYAYKEGQKLCSSMRMIILVGVALLRSFDSTGLMSDADLELLDQNRCDEGYVL